MKICDMNAFIICYINYIFNTISMLEREVSSILILESNLENSVVLLLK